MSAAPRTDLLHRRFDAAARTFPDRVALVHGDRQMTYGELDARASRLAARLQRQGIRPGDRVAVSLPRSAELIVALLGILKTGAAYVPVDPAYPAERLAYLFADCRPAAVIGTLAPTAVSVPVLAPEDDGGTGGGGADAAVNGDPQPQDPIYVIYTSGSTGRPKGAVNHQIGFANLLDWYIDEFGLDASDVALVVTSPSFDLTQKNLFAPLLVGGRLVLSDQEVFDPAMVADCIAREGVTLLNLTPSMFTALVDGAPSGSLHSLRRVFLGGEPIHLQRLQAMHAEYPQIELVNSYGPTECADVSAFHRVDPDWSRYDFGQPPIGAAVPRVRLAVVDAALRPVAPGVVGEIVIGGVGVGLGYLDRPELTAERFIAHPELGRIYRTGDLGRALPDGQIAYLGRSDFQLKIRGFRIEPGEIEDRLRSLDGVKDAVVSGQARPGSETRLVAHVLVDPSQATTATTLRAQLSRVVPDYMVPSVFMLLDRFPLSPNGKVDRKALPAPDSRRPDLEVPFEAPRGATEALVCDCIADLLGIDAVGRRDSFFDLGGTSLQAVQLARSVRERSGRPLSTAAIFAHPAAAEIAPILDGDRPQDTRFRSVGTVRSGRGDADPRHAPIAIIGAAGRFPGAASVDALWRNLLDEVDGITHFTETRLAPGIAPELLADANYVRARGVIDGHDLFDNSFFGISPREAALLDPQHRVMLEVAWECLESAGYAPDATDRPVGVFAGVYGNYYLQRQLMRSPGTVEKAGDLPVLLANDKDYSVLRVADKLHLTGPAVAVHTSCSTSLAAVAQAVDSLRLGRCDMALAGGVTIVCPPNTGYLYQEGAMLSRDGHTRTFDSEASGTTFNDGAAMVLLKRLDDALADGDDILAVIDGIGLNNDGGGKASFSAPSVDGQAAVIAAALDDAGVDPRGIDYVEAHGTATPLGDPIEIEALTQAWRRHTRDTAFCRIGSLKSNIGHLVTAAGAASLIKTALALRHETLPASLHFRHPNPQIDFAGSPFIVNDRRTPWPRDAARVRRAAVSNFGVGGTNVHAIVREAPSQTPSSAAHGPQLILLSARTPTALAAQAERLAAHLRGSTPNLADVAHTLQAGRSRFAHRLCVVGATADEITESLLQPGHARRAQREVPAAEPAQVWLFPGQGAQYAGMGSGLYAADADFRAAFDAALAAFAPHLDFDLRARMFDGDADALTGTATTQPATFCLEYAVAQTWLARGARPTALIGHSVGEFVAAGLAGVMTLDDAARLVARRGALMQALPPGSMLSVRLAAPAILAKLPAALSLAAENGPSACVVAGPTPEIEAFHAALSADGVQSRLLQTSHAFHSAMMDAALDPFAAEVATVTLAAPRLPIVSTRTGTWLTEADAIRPDYWVRHLREPVRFSPAVRETLAHHPGALFLEVGPRGSLCTLARQHAPAGGAATLLAIPSLGDRPEDEAAQMLLAQGMLWTVGIDLPASAASPATGRRRVRLPTYPFERKRHWVEAQAPQVTTAVAPAATPETPASAPAARTESAANVLTFPSPASVSAMPTDQPNGAASPRKDSLVARLRDLLEDVSGSPLDSADAGVPFVELGLDSLTLTQAAIQIKKEFGVPVTFRQLMETLRSMDLLATHLDAQLPPEPAAAAAAAPAAPVPAAPAPTTQPGISPSVAIGSIAMPSAPFQPQMPSAGAPASAVQQLIGQQMQLMAQQLALLGGTAFAAAPPAIAASAPIAAPVAPATPSPANQAAVPVAPPAENPADEPDTQRYDVKKAFGAIARIHTQASPLTERQRARLAAFMRRYVERTAKSRAYTEQYRPHLADPRVVNGFRPMIKDITYQIVVERSKGAHLWDLDGNEYVDALNGFGMSLFGWQPDFVLDAVRQQLDDGYDIGPQHPLAGLVADLVCELTGFDRAGLCNTGSEAVMAAVRIARTVTGRSTVVLFSGSYHGTFDEVVVRPGKGGKGIPGAPGIMRGMFGDVRVLDYGTPESLEFIRANADDLAAVLVEPVQSRRPEFRPVDFLKEVRAITERSGTCLIFDEVITGFRSALGGAQQLFGIRADLASYGKVIGGGMPIGVIAGKRQFMDALDGGAWQYGDDSIPTVGVTYFAGTFVRHPLALAAAHASLQHLKQQGPALQETLNARTTALAEELSAFCREAGAPLEVRHFASLWRVAWLEDHPLQDLLFAMMRSRGVHILDNFPCFLTTAHSEADVRLIADAFRESVRELQESEFLPRHKSPVSVVFDATKPPVPGARLGKDAAGKPAWFVPNPEEPGKYLKVSA